MAFGCSVEEFENYCAERYEKLSKRMFIEFGLHKGFITGFSVLQRPKIMFNKIFASVQDYMLMPALIIVESKYNKGIEHAIYWDGAMVLDPDPATEDGSPLKSYRIKEWFTIFNFKTNEVTS